MLKHDKQTVDAIIDRCSAGGSDNRKGVRFLAASAERQIHAYLETIESPAEREEVIYYFRQQQEIEQANES